MYKKSLKNNIISTSMNHRLIRNNFNKGRIAELKWIKKLSKKYPSIRDNNEVNKFSSMDASSADNDILIEHEHKNRNDLRYGQYTGPMFSLSKLIHSDKQLKKGIRQIYYWTLVDDNNKLYYWEYYNKEKQKDEIHFNNNGNFSTGEGSKRVVDIKWKYLKLYED